MQTKRKTTIEGEAETSSTDQLFVADQNQTEEALQANIHPDQMALEWDYSTAQYTSLQGIQSTVSPKRKGQGRQTDHLQAPKPYIG